MGWGEGVWFRGPGFWGGFWNFGTPDPGALGSGAQVKGFQRFLWFYGSCYGVHFSGRIAAGELRYDVMQFPGQAGATKGCSRGGGGARKEARRFCTGFEDGLFDGRCWQ